MGDLSRYNQAVKGYMQNGLSREAAEKQAGWDAARELTSTALRGGIRGIAFAAGGMAFNAGRQRLGSSTDSLYAGNRRNDAQVNDMAARAANGQIAGPGASKASVETDYTKEDFRTAQLLNQDAPRSPFTMESQSGIMGEKFRDNKLESTAKCYTVG